MVLAVEKPLLIKALDLLALTICSALLASSFEMLCVPGFHVSVEACCCVHMHDEGIVLTH